MTCSCSPQQSLFLPTGYRSTRKRCFACSSTYLSSFHSLVRSRDGHIFSFPFLPSPPCCSAYGEIAPNPPRPPVINLPQPNPALYNAFSRREPYANAKASSALSPSDLHLSPSLASANQAQAHARRVFQFGRLHRGRTLARRQLRRYRHRARRLGPANLPPRSLAVARA